MLGSTVRLHCVSLVARASPRGVVMAFLEKVDLRANAVLLPTAGRKDAQEKETSATDARATPHTMGKSVAYT